MQNLRVFYYWILGQVYYETIYRLISHAEIFKIRKKIFRNDITFLTYSHIQKNFIWKFSDLVVVLHNYDIDLHAQNNIIKLQFLSFTINFCHQNITRCVNLFLYNRNSYDEFLRIFIFNTLQHFFGGFYIHHKE